LNEKRKAKSRKKKEKEKQSNTLKKTLRELKHVQLEDGDSWVIDDSELEFVELLGTGASGKVYRGLYRGNEVALKVLKPTSEEKELAEFKREFQVISAVKSEHVVHFYGASINNKLCMVMEFCSRGSLWHIMNDLNTPWSWCRVFDFSLQTCKGIQALHSCNPQILHRDMKSLNLLVTEDWHVKVCDFGLSRFDTGSNLETLGKLRGTYAYAAPEVYFGQRYTTHSDVYSIAIILWELVVRTIKGKYERPFEEYPHLTMDFQIIIQSAKKGLRPTIPPTCFPPLAQLIKDCIEEQKEKRQPIEKMIETLEMCKKHETENPDFWLKSIVPN